MPYIPYLCLNPQYIFFMMVTSSHLMSTFLIQVKEFMVSLGRVTCTVLLISAPDQPGMN